MNPSPHSLSPKSALWLFLMIAGLSGGFPAVSYAVKAGGGTTTTMALTYVNGLQKWVAGISPLDVEGFQLDIAFDPSRARLDTSVGLNGIVYKSPFNQTTS